jgi:hypothetical protein
MSSDVLSSLFKFGYVSSSLVMSLQILPCLFTSCCALPCHVMPSHATTRSSIFEAFPLYIPWLSELAGGQLDVVEGGEALEMLGAGVGLNEMQYY